MEKRTAAFFGVFMLCMFLCVLSLYTVSDGAQLAATANNQSSYKLVVAKTRGTIYDCNKVALTGAGKEYAAAVAPSVEGAAALSKVLPEKEMEDLYPSLTAGKPFALKLPQSVSAGGIDVFTLDKRYADKQTAVHILGYLDGSGAGAAGIEKAFNKQLTQNQGQISITYKVDAVNRVLAGEDKKISDSSYLQNSGVVLTIDKNIQEIAEKAAGKYLTKGAVIVTEVPSCKIRAMVSLPDFSPNNIAAALNAEDSPLVNRCLCAYNVGSVFKLVSASAALEYGISPDTQYTCTGSIDVDGGIFHCFNGESHGSENMKAAVAQSCNAYFVNLMKQVPQAQFLLMAQSMGFGRSFEIAPGITSASGNLPTLKSLNIPRALANFSFGQGDLTATPLQIAAMVNAIASGGEYTQPYLYEGIVDENLNNTAKAPAQKSTQVISQNTVVLLRDFMKESIETGTSKKGKPTTGGAGAKTATAQTGRYVNSVESVESWFAGFYPYENPKYVITVFAEDGTGGGATCGPVFKEIADALAAKIGQ
ncbi:peptidoglycan D,D-transpeptidase FtsI family protein [Caproiciproducens faecalis]|uniref:Penicillin-binding protein 2 n=1 Tax=Caproiciproducens faecalis TaxID=2820301 RepID=A0ABS7DPS5_9FIRM|nr:penicillin-binding protein 2 [Caproiciproducens faecalis]MBW7573311.1 penicillin-binding protein 2 [Caproiciproducens faecalis]